MSKHLDGTSAQVIVEEIAAIEVSQNDDGAGSPSEQHYVEELVDKTKLTDKCTPVTRRAYTV